MPIRPRSLLLLTTLLTASCSGHLFSGLPRTDRSRPIARIELRGHGPRLGATTTEGIVFLNEDKATGPCRVHYFLGPVPLVESGEVLPFGGPYALAEIDLKTQAVPVLTRELRPEDDLVAVVFDGPEDVEWIDVELADATDVQGYALRWPGCTLPHGTPIFRIRTDHVAGGLQFVGLARGAVTVRRGTATERYVVFTGPSHMRAALAVPKPMFTPRRVIHRPDDITVVK